MPPVAITVIGNGMCLRINSVRQKMKTTRITGSWLAYASTEPNETSSLVERVTASGHDVESANVGNSIRFWLRDLGPLGSTLEDSPVVVVYPPRKLSDRLFTLGRFFFPQPELSRRFPAIARIRRKVESDLKGTTVLWTRGATEPGQFDYYLEGSIRNQLRMVYGMHSSIPYLRQEGYFVLGDESEPFMETLRRKLALRGVKI
jgi:hypothetical protein